MHLSRIAASPRKQLGPIQGTLITRAGSNACSQLFHKTNDCTALSLATVNGSPRESDFTLPTRVIEHITKAIVGLLGVVFQFKPFPFGFWLSIYPYYYHKGVPSAASISSYVLIFYIFGDLLLPTSGHLWCLP